MLKRGTLLLMTGAILLGGAVLLLESRQGASERAETSSGETSVLDTKRDGELIFPFEEGDVERVTLTRPDETLTFERDNEGVWQMVQPAASAAEEGAIAFLLSQLTNPTTRTLKVDPDTLSDFGLGSPDTTIALTAADSEYTLAVGTADFTGDKLYVKLTEPAPEATGTEADSTTETETVYVVSGGLQNAVTRPTEEWTLAEDEEEEATSEDVEESIVEGIVEESLAPANDEPATEPDS